MTLGMPRRSVLIFADVANSAIEPPGCRYSGDFMRIGVGGVVIVGLLASGCSSTYWPGLAPTSDPQILAPASHGTGQSQIFDDFLNDDSDIPPSKTRHRSKGEGAKQTTSNDFKPVQFLSARWAKEDAPQKEDWEKRLDQTVHNVCQGC